MKGLFTRTTKSKSDIRSIDDASWQALGKGIVGRDENLAPAINQAVTLISGSIASLRPMLMEVDDTGKRKLVDKGHPVWRLLRKPCDWLTWSEFVSEIIRDILLYGNSYVVVKDNQLIPVEPSGVQCRTGQTQLVYHVTYQFPRHMTETVSAEMMLHFKSGALDTFRVCGIAPLDRTPSIRELADAMQTAVITGYKQGVYPSLVVQIMDEKLSDEDAERLHDRLQRRFSAVNGFQKPLVIGQKFSVTDAKPASNKESQMLEGRRYLVSEVARVFNISETLLNKLDNATLANVREYSKQLHTYCLKPHITRFQQTFNQLLEDGIELILDQREFTEGDTLERRQSILDLYKNKLITDMEARELLDLGESKGGNYFEDKKDGTNTI